MPNIKSQKDRVVQAKKEALHNKTIKSNLKQWSRRQTLPSTAMLLTRRPSLRSLSLPSTLLRARVSSIRTPLPARSAAWLSAPTRLLLSN